MVEANSASPQVGIPSDGFRALFGKAMPVVPVHLYNHVVMGKVEVHEVGAEGLMPLKGVSPERERPGDKILQAGRLCKTVALLRAIPPTSYLGAVALDRKPFAANGADHINLLASPCREAFPSAISPNAPAHPTERPIDRLPARGAWSGGAECVRLSAALYRAIGTSRRRAPLPVNLRVHSGKRRAANQTLTMLHNVSIISQVRPEDKRVDVLP